MILRICLVLIVTMILNVLTFAAAPPVEAGVSRELARWRAAHYSDVRYKLNLTLEKGAPLLKGDIEIRVKFSDAEIIKRQESDDELIGGSNFIFVLDWRKIKGQEDSYSTNKITLNGKRADVKEVNEHLIINNAVNGENVIKLQFTSPIATSGAAVTRYVDKEDNAEYIYSLFVPSDASTAFPCFDQPDLKARFQLTIQALGYNRVVSNTDEKPILAWTSPLALTFHTFKETEPISTYVFAFAAGDFAVFEDANNSTPRRESGAKKIAGRETSGKKQTARRVEDAQDNAFSRVFNAPNAALNLSRRFTSGYSLDAPSARRTANATPTTTENVSTKIFVRKSQAEKFKQHAAEVFRLNREGVKFLEGYFDFKFPFPKYDLVLIPEFPFGGMEHAGATFLRESSIIFPTEPTANDYISRGNVIFHEAAHQWFGDTVTMRWFDDLWLKEGFAEFMAYTMEKVLPQYNAWKAFYERNKPLAYQTDSTRGTTAIYQEIPNLSAAKSAYGNIVYRKAPSFLRQAEFYLGADKFQTAVRSFLKQNAFKNAEWQDLVKSFETASGQDLKDWANVWVKKHGTSVVSVLPNETSLFNNAMDFNMALKTMTLENGVGKSAIFKQRQTIGEYAGLQQTIKLLRVLENGVKQEVIFTLNEDLNEGKPTAIRAIPPTDNKADSTLVITREQIEKWRKEAEEKRKLKVAYVFPNYQDYGYGIFLLDERSRNYILANIQNEKDDFLRAMMWGALWDSVREAELNPRDYVELAIKNVGAETDELTANIVLNRVATAMNYYLTDKQQTELAPRLEQVLLARMRTAETLGQRVVFYRAFLNLVTTDDARQILKDLLSSKFQISGFKLKAKDKFDIVTRLLILDDKDAPRLLAELEKSETSDDAKRYAYAARAGIGTSENKLKFYNDFTNNKDISESYIETALTAFNPTRQSDLTFAYLDKALTELPNLKRTRKIFFINNWLAAFIGGQKDERALKIVNKFLNGNPNLDKDLRLKVLENVDLLERAVKIKAKFNQ